MKFLPGKNGKWHFWDPKNKNFLWRQPPHPPRGSRLRHSFHYALLCAPKRKNHATPPFTFLKDTGSVNWKLLWKCWNICRLFRFNIFISFLFLSIRTSWNPDCRWDPVYNVKSNVMDIRHNCAVFCGECSYWWFAYDVMAAMLVDRNNKIFLLWE